LISQKKILKLTLTCSAAFLFFVLLYFPEERKCLAQSSQPAMNLKMTGRTVVIDPGHGGDDPGTIGCQGTLEKYISLAISKKLALFFKQAGAKVVLTREGDRIAGFENGGGEANDLKRRLKIARQVKADIILSIHLNHFSDSSEYGAQVFYQHGSTQSKMLADQIQLQLNSLLIDSGRGALGGDFYLCRLAKGPAVIVEVGFLSHPGEESKFNTEDYQAQAAWAIYRGTVNFFQLTGA